MGSQNKMLLVDDETNVLKALKRVFIDDDYTIFTSPSGKDALEILESESDIEVIISDYRMPSMTGVDFFREVCARWPQTIRIILSGYADTPSVVSAINEGQIYKFIPKPWNDDEIREIIRNAFDKKTFTQSSAQHENDIMRIQELLDSIPVAIIESDNDGGLVFVNNRANSIYKNSLTKNMNLKKIISRCIDAAFSDGFCSLTFLDGPLKLVLKAERNGDRVYMAILEENDV